MNKYQEALGYFLDREEGENITVTCDWLIYAEDLQELVDEFMKNQEPKERCRECDECEFLNYNYCHNCGNEFGGAW